MFNRDGIKSTTYGAPVQILANVELQYSMGCRVPQSLGTDVTGVGKIAKAGTPVFIDLGSREAVPVAVPGAVTETATGSVVTGAYKFKATVAEGTTTWKLGNDTVTLNTYGITVTGTVANNDEIQVVFTASGTVSANAVLLHNVDVTAGTKNGTALLFGFVNYNRLESDVQALVTPGTKIGDVQIVKG